MERELQNYSHTITINCIEVKSWSILKIERSHQWTQSWNCRKAHYIVSTSGTSHVLFVCERRCLTTYMAGLSRTRLTMKAHENYNRDGSAIWAPHHANFAPCECVSKSLAISNPAPAEIASARCRKNVIFRAKITILPICSRPTRK